jgi:ribosomal protein S18 acetylase RimI-like enzyme
MTVSIRAATTADLPATREFLVATWHDTYDGLIGPAKVTELTDRWHKLETLAGQIDMPGTSFLVAETPSAGIVGHAFGQARSPPILALARLYVLPSHQRQSIVGRLLAALVARHPEATCIRLHVEAANTKGVAFYRRQGFVNAGEVVEDGLKTLRLEKILVG